MMSSACCTTPSRGHSLARAFLLALSLTLLPQAWAQAGPDAQSRLAALADSTALSAVGRPWHLRTEVTLYDKSGAVAQTGTIERWQDGKDARTVRTFGDITQTELEHGGQSYRSAGQQIIPQPAEILFRAVLHPGPFPYDSAGLSPEWRESIFGKTKLNCVILSGKLAQAKSPPPLGLFPTYCLSQANQLALMYHFGQTVVRERAGQFLSHEITLEATLSQPHQLLARIKVLQLSTFAPSPDEFEPAKELVEVASRVQISGGVITGHKLTGSQPAYPEEERREGLSGTVVLKATIGREGHIYDLVPMSAPDASFAISALAAVRDWTYSPYLLNGLPTEVTTTITVNYSMRSY